MQCKSVKYYSKRCVDLSLMGFKILPFLFLVTLFGAASWICPQAHGAMTLNPVNGTLPVPSPTPYLQGQLTFNYYVTGVGTPPPLAPAFYDPSVFTPLDVSKGAGYNDGSGGNPWVGDIPANSLANAFGINISSNANLQVTANTVVMIQIQTNGGSRYIPIAGVGGAGGSNRAVCDQNNCLAPNLNNVISLPQGAGGGGNVRIPYYAARVYGNNFSVYFYPKDICQDNIVNTVSGCTNGNVDDPGAGVTSLSLSFVIQNLPNPVPTPLTGVTSLDSTTNPLVFSFQNRASTFMCPNLANVTFRPDDGRIYIDASQFVLTRGGAGTLAEGQNFIVAANEGAAPNLTNALLQSGTNSFVSNQYGSYGTSLYFASGFQNSDGAALHPYYLGFMVQDAAGIYTPPSIQASPSPSPAPTPAFPPGPANQSCTLFGPIETSSVNGFLSRDTRCFIATAAFQSPNAAPVEMLREFRDRVLLRSTPGIDFVEWYYQWSPRAAEWLNDHPLFRLPVLLWLFELQVMAWFCLHPGVFFSVLATLLGLGIGWLKMNGRKMHAS